MYIVDCRSQSNIRCCLSDSLKCERFKDSFLNFFYSRPSARSQKTPKDEKVETKPRIKAEKSGKKNDSVIMHFRDSAVCMLYFLIDK